MSFGVPVGYSPNPDNIGNLKSSDEEYKMLVDGIITSPPYANTSLQDYGTSDKALLEFEAEVRKSFKEKGYFEYNGKRYTEKEWREINKGELKPRGIPELWAKILKNRQDSGYNTANPENIGNLPISDEECKILIDSIITSPPYAHESTASEPTKLEKEGKFKMGHSKETSYTEENYREWSKHVGGNIGKRKMMVRVPCSPEEADFHDTRPERKGTVWEWTKEVEATPEIVEQIQKQKDEKKGKSETYLEAMLKVYTECYKVLRYGGRAIIIVKPFVRGKRPIDLPYHTWLLMEKVGFKLEKVYKLRLQTKSFWRILYEKRHPEVPKIRHEWIIVARKE
jgi:DNA modification methylase